MENVLLKVVLENNPELFIHATRVENGLVSDKTGQTIVVQVSTEKIPKGFKLKSGRHGWYYVETKVLATNVYSTSKPYFTEYGWKADSEMPPSELEAEE